MRYIIGLAIGSALLVAAKQYIVVPMGGMDLGILGVVALCVIVIIGYVSTLRTE